MENPNPAQTLRKPYTRSNHVTNYLCYRYFSLISTSIQYTHYCPSPRSNWTIVCPFTPHQTHQSISYSESNKVSHPRVFLDHNLLVGSNFDLILTPRPSVWSHIRHRHTIHIQLDWKTISEKMKNHHFINISYFLMGTTEIIIILHVLYRFWTVKTNY